MTIAVPICSIAGCLKPRRSRGAKWCEMHYGRFHRHGDPMAVRRVPTSYKRSNGYVLAYCPGHPLSNSEGWVAQHRQVVYDRVGSGPHACEWCGAVVDWGAGLDVDHRDNDRSNNDAANLVVSCHACNSGRGQAKTLEAWFLQCAIRRVLRERADEVAAAAEAVAERFFRPASGESKAS